MNIALPAAQQDRLGTHRRQHRLRPLAGIQSRQILPRGRPGRSERFAHSKVEACGAMRPLLAGADRGLEYQVVGQAPARGRQVTGKARRAEAWDATATGLSVGDGAAGDDLSSGSRAVAGQDAAIRALGDPPWWAGRKGPATVSGARTGRAA
ncbi:hypothetical protein ACH49O_10285 [Streptomyces coeruleorubidus]|uniref:hypothetical protein n=1 Tax=Streptomyces coeruleorubidus TaxID=116188 RepID=UPI003404E60C